MWLGWLTGFGGLNNLSAISAGRLITADNTDVLSYVRGLGFGVKGLAFKVQGIWIRD